MPSRPASSSAPSPGPRRTRRSNLGPPSVRLDFAPLPLRLRHAWTIARGSADTKLNGLLTLRAEGVRGHGEAAPSGRYGQSFESARAGFAGLRQALAGKSPWAHREWLEVAEQLLPGETALRAALDAALWDWKARRLGQPLHRLLGTPGDFLARTSYSIGMDTPEQMGQRAGEASRFAVLKVKLGLPGERRMLDSVRAARDCRLWVDANEGWRTPRQAERMAGWLADRGVELLEQPLPAGREAELRPLLPQLRLALVADESALNAADLPRLAGSVHGVNIKLAKCGGITRALEMIATARALGLRVLLGCMIESSLGIAAALPLAPLVDWIDLDGNLLLAADPFGGLELCGDRWRQPSRPGLGVFRRRVQTNRGDQLPGGR